MRLDKIPESTLSKTQQAYSVEPMDRNTLNLGATDTRDMNLSKTPNNKSGKVSVMEQNFIKEYRHLEDLEREKGIKFF